MLCEILCDQTMGFTLQRLLSSMRALPFKLLMYLVHFCVLVCAYIQYYVRALRIFMFQGQRAASRELEKVKKIPEHVAIVIDEKSSRFDGRISQAVDFLAGVPGVRHITLFFRHGKHSVTTHSEKVRTFVQDDVAVAFKDAMLSKSQIESVVKPLSGRLDLVVIFSRTPSLCNFFPWMLDLATFVFAGPVVGISPLALVDSFMYFEKAEQRFGK